MSKEDFARDQQSAGDWLDGLLKVWTDGEKESDEIVSHWTESFKSLTASTREELQALKDTADQAGYTGISEQLVADMEALDSLDAEIEALLASAQTQDYYSDRYACAYLTADDGSTAVWYLDGASLLERARMAAFFGVGQLCLSDLSSVADYENYALLGSLTAEP